jgi:hypothetical protein
MVGAALRIPSLQPDLFCRLFTTLYRISVQNRRLVCPATSNLAHSSRKMLQRLVFKSFPGGTHTLFLTSFSTAAERTIEGVP